VKLFHSLFVAVALVFAALLSGCADTRYVLQSVTGHWQMMQAARPVAELLQDDATPAALKQRLELAQRIRQFAVTELKLPDTASYQRYADLKRPAVVWNVVAAPEFSLTLKTWCFPVVGCVGYRGYFNELDARAFAETLKAQGLEVSVYGVPAYSTLGWLNWAGGDPLINTFVGYPEGELARMIFHEMAHQVLYVKDDTLFNESFATAVERLGGERWLAANGSQKAKNDDALRSSRRRDFRALCLANRQKLEVIYKENSHLEQGSNARAAIKKIAMESFKNDYAALKKSWGGFGGYDTWVAGANNASFAMLAAYDEGVPGFEALFDRNGQDWARFYDAVKGLAKLSALERSSLLKRPVTE
jgi:predicted aminopeptidase